MERFAWRLFLAAILWWASASSQMIERDREVLILKNVIDKLDEIKTILEEQQTKLSALEESQMTIKNDVNETLSKMADLEASQSEMQKSQNTTDDILRQQLTKTAALEASQMAIRSDIRETLSKMADLEASQSEMQKSQNTTDDILRQQRIDYQECATRVQVETIQNTSIAERQELRDSLQRCNVRDEIPTLYNLFKTDECQTETHSCNADASCTDDPFSYKCSCNKGYSGDGFTCEDVDECNMGQHRCHVNATCVNTIGGYNCTCNLPYAEDGYTCPDLVCTSPSVWIEDLGCIRLLYPEGYTWENAQAKCEREGSRLTESIQKKHLDILFQHFGETTKIGGIWIGVKDEKWLSTGYAINIDLFHSGEPSRKEGENCIHLHLKEDCIGLGDSSCTRTFYALCQSHYQGIVS